MYCCDAYAVKRIEFKWPAISPSSHNKVVEKLPCPCQASVVAVFVSEAAPAPEEEGAGMRSALEYLQKLDKYYSQIARPRYDSTIRQTTNFVVGCKL